MAGGMAPPHLAPSAAEGRRTAQDRGPGAPARQGRTMRGTLILPFEKHGRTGKYAEPGSAARVAETRGREPSMNTIENSESETDVRGRMWLWVGPAGFLGALALLVGTGPGAGID